MLIELIKEAASLEKPVFHLQRAGLAKGKGRPAWRWGGQWGRDLFV
jgi:hypothetical protein